MKKSLIFLFVLFFCFSSRASVQDIFGLGSRGPAMGNAVVSTSNGYEAVFFNPSGLMLSPRNEVAVGFNYGRFNLKIDGQVQDVFAAGGLLIGANYPFPLKKSLKDKFALGFGIFIPRDSILFAKLPFYGEPYFALLETRSQITAVQLAFAYKVTKDFRLGISFLTLAGLKGQIDVEPNKAGKIGSRVETKMLSQYSFGLGLGYDYEDFKFGLVFKSASRSDFELPIKSNLGKDACIAGTCLALPKLNIKGLAQYDPSQIASDISWVYGDSFQLSLGVIYRFWSKIPQIIERVNPGSPHPDPTKFKDTLSPSLGTEYRIFKEKTLSIFLRSGVFYSPSPVPQGGHLARRVDNHRTTFSLGSGTVIKDGDTEFFLDNFFQFHYLVPREFPQKEIDTIHSDGNFWMGGFSLGIRQ